MKARHFLLLGLAFVMLWTAIGIARAETNTLTWDYLTSDVTQYGITVFNVERKVQACSGTGPFVEIATVASTLRTYADTTAVPGATYCYRVAATGPGGKSPYSNTAEKTVPFAVPVAPTNLRAQ